MKVLLIAPYYPPDNAIASRRLRLMAMGLSNAGAEVCVAKIENNTHAFVDDISDNVIKPKIHIQPTIITKWMINNLNRNKNHPLSLVARLIHRILIVDSYLPSVPKIVKEIDELILHKTPQVIITSSLPFSFSIVGSRLKKKHQNIFWVADNRDWWAFSPYFKSYYIIELLRGKIEHHVYKKADLLLSIGQVASKWYKQQHNIDTLPVYNCSSLYKRIDSDCKGNGTIVYAGTLYGGRRSIYELFEAVKIINKPDKLFRIVYRGPDLETFLSVANKYSNIVVEAQGNVPQENLKKLYMNASAIVVINGKTNYDEMVLTGKFFEILEYRKPIIALTHKQSELASLVNGHKLGIATFDFHKIAQFLRTIEGTFLVPKKVPDELHCNTIHKNLYDRISAMVN